MESSRAKKLIDEYLTYEEAKQLLVKLVQFPSPQTALLEKEPQVLALIQQTIRPELEKDGIRPIIDDKGNLIATLKGEEDQGKSLLLVSYAMNAAPATMQNPYSGEIVDGTPYQIEGECVWGRGACEQKGSLAAMMLAIKNHCSMPSQTTCRLDICNQHSRRNRTAPFGQPHSKSQQDKN